MVCIGKKAKELMEEPMLMTPQCKRINSRRERGVGDKFIHSMLARIVMVVKRHGGHTRW